MDQNRKLEWYSFWVWFFEGYGKKPGYRRVINPWLGIDLGISILFLIFGTENLAAAYASVIMPTAGFLVGLTIAVAASAHAVLISNEVSDLAVANGSSSADYVYVFLLAVLGVMASAIFWVLIGIFSPHGPGERVAWWAVAFTFSGAVRLSWGALHDLSSLVLAVHEVRKAQDE